jgi:hypothetical protein
MSRRHEEDTAVAKACHILSVTRVHVDFITLSIFHRE